MPLNGSEDDLLRAFEAIRKRLWDLEDAAFERRLGLDFGPPVGRSDLRTSYARSRAHAHGYQGVRYRKMRILLNEARKLGIAFDTFVDVGCGTGKACCIASLDKGFTSIVGIDFSAELIAAAERNRSILGDGRLQFCCLDAADYSLPDARCLVFLFNPFDGVMLGRFIERNRVLLRRNDCAVACANAPYPQVFEAAGLQAAYEDKGLRLSLYRPVRENRQRT
jgi:SAM-dependent methyltransferase